MAAKNKVSAKKTGPKIKKAKAGKWVIANARAVTKSKAGQIAVTIIAAGALGTLAYFAYKQFRKKRGNVNSDVDVVMKQLSDSDRTDIAITPHTLPTIKPKKSTSRNSNDEFPLKKGSKGEMVRKLQQALIAKYGTSVLPKYGADGDFGSETASALKKNGLPQTIDESTFNVLVEGQQGFSVDLSGIGKRLYDAASSKNLVLVTTLLKSIKNKEQYQQVNSEFSKYRLRGVHQTLVNGLLGTFPVESQKQQIRLEFLRIGLQYNGNKWSLSGFDGKTIVTSEGADVWVTPTQSVQVPPRMVLGNEVAQRLDYILFENNNRYFLIKSKSVRYL